MHTGYHKTACVSSSFAQKKEADAVRHPLLLPPERDTPNQGRAQRNATVRSYRKYGLTVVV